MTGNIETKTTTLKRQRVSAASIVLREKPMKKINNNGHLIILTKETPKARKERVSSGAKFRPVIFADKKRRALSKKPSAREELGFLSAHIEVD